MAKLIIEICKIEEIKPIDKADKIELAIIKGWQCIVSKGQYEAGNLVIYCPPDSIIPPNLIEKYKLEFLRDDGRVKTIKLRGERSEGLILDIECLSISLKHKLGDDVSKELGIAKWEPPERQGEPKPKETFRSIYENYKEGKMSLRRFLRKELSLTISTILPSKKNRKNPAFREYTDIENIKHYPEIFEEGESIVIQEKIHGSNSRAGWLLKYKDNLWGKFMSLFFGEWEFVYGSHTVQKHPLSWNKGWYKEDFWLEMVHKYDLKNKIPKGYVVYFEVYGDKVQDLTYGLKNERRIVIFDVMKDGTYLDFDKMIEFCRLSELPIAPILNYGGGYSKYIIDEHTLGMSCLYLKQIREGCVVRPLKETIHQKIGRKILKSISIDYLTRKGNTTEFH
jgi:hypothetical protein